MNLVWSFEVIKLSQTIKLFYVPQILKRNSLIFDLGTVLTGSMRLILKISTIYKLNELAYILSSYYQLLLVSRILNKMLSSNSQFF